MMSAVAKATGRIGKSGCFTLSWEGGEHMNYDLIIWSVVVIVAIVFGYNGSKK